MPVVRSLASLSFRRLLGRGLSSRCDVDAGVVLSIPSGLGVLPSDESCEDCGDGYEKARLNSEGGVGDRDAGQLSGELGASEWSSSIVFCRRDSTAGRWAASVEWQSRPGT
jgi:hypothetical protein